MGCPSTISQAHSYQWLGTFGNPGNGHYRTELRKALAAITRYLTAYQFPKERALLRLDGQYGTGAVLSDLVGFSFVTRGKEYSVLDHPLVQARLQLPPDQQQQRPESQIVRSLYDCPAVPVGSAGVLCRVVVATHPAGKQQSPVGLTRAGVVYELFFTALPQQGFTACDVVELYLHRGAFESALADEDAELDPDRWCSHSAWGQEAGQIVSQWIWNLRAVRWGISFNPSRSARPNLHQPCHLLHRTRLLPRAMLPRRWAYPGKPVASRGKTLLSSPMGHCAVLLTSSYSRMSIAGKPTGGSLRVVYGASIRKCRPCPLREQCQWNGAAIARPRQVSVLLHPLQVGPAPLLWRDWSRRVHRRACIQLVRHQRMEVSIPPPPAASPTNTEVILSRAQRAHVRLSWETRLDRNASNTAASQVTIKLFGVPEQFAEVIGIKHA